jgi:pyruvate formate lyase activating enzyme
MLDRPATPLETLIKAREIGLKVGLKFVYPGNISISGAEDTYCPKCQKAVIIRSGYRIKKNEVQNSCCSFCQAAIAGIWSTT